MGCFGLTGDRVGGLEFEDVREGVDVDEEEEEDGLLGPASGVGVHIPSNS